MNRIKKDDSVKVISGNHKGKTGRVIKILKVKNRAIVEGVNLAKKLMRPSQEKGGLFTTGKLRHQKYQVNGILGCIILEIKFKTVMN